MTPRLYLLGGARIVSTDGAAMQGRAAHRRRLAVLAVLGAARGRPVGRERIMSLLWPDSNQADARHSLVESLSVIRRELGDDPFLCVGDEVALDPSRLGSDVEEFGRAVAAGNAQLAISLYAGPFLDGFVVKDAPEFDRWVEEERGALAAAFARVLEAEALRRQEAGDVPGAVDVWRRLAAHDRFSTRAAVRLARALEATGDTAAAVQHLAVHETMLREELELDPPAELVQAIEGLRRGTSRRPAPPLPPPVPSPGPDPTPAPEVVRRADVPEPVSFPPPQTTVWLAALAGLDRLRSGAPETAVRAQTHLRILARHAAEHAGGGIDGVVGDALLARFSTPRAATAAAVTLLRRWEATRAHEDMQADLVVGMDYGSAGSADQRLPDEATLRASVLRSRAEPSTILTTGALAREAGPLAGVETTQCGTATLPGGSGPEPLVRITVSGSARGHRTRAEARAPAAPRRRSTSRLVPPLAAAAALSTTLVVAAWLAGARGGGAQDAPDAFRSERRSRIAVLGCEAPRTADSLRALCDGTMDLVSIALSRVPSIDVVRPFTGAEGRPYWSAGTALDSIARGLGGLLVLSARLEGSGGQLRQVLFLADPLRGGVIVDADTLEVSGNGLRLQETLSARTSNLLRRRLGVRVTMRTAGQATRSADARSLFLRARLLRYEAVDSLGSPDRLRTDMAIRDLAYADTLLRRAEAADPRWVEPVVERGWIALLQGKASLPARRRTYFQRARAHGSRAVAMDGNDAGALELRGRARWALTELAAYADSGKQLTELATKDLVRARALDEERASALYALSELQYFQGDFNASLHTARQAYRADPYLEGGIALLERQFSSVLSMGRLDLAEGFCADGARYHPRDFRFVECRLVLAARGGGDTVDTAAAASLRRRLEGEFPAARADSIGMDYQPIYWQTQHAAVLARAGATARARKELEEARLRTLRRMDEATRRGEPSDDNWISFLFDEAQVLLLLGDSAAARQALNDLAARRPYYRGFVRSEHLFRGLFTRPLPRSPASP